MSAVRTNQMNARCAALNGIETRIRLKWREMTEEKKRKKAIKNDVNIRTEKGNNGIRLCNTFHLSLLCMYMPHFLACTFFHFFEECKRNAGEISFQTLKTCTHDFIMISNLFFFICVLCCVHRNNLDGYWIYQFFLYLCAFSLSLVFIRVIVVMIIVNVQYIIHTINPFNMNKLFANSSFPRQYSNIFTQNVMQTSSQTQYCCVTQSIDFLPFFPRKWINWFTFLPTLKLKTPPPLPSLSLSLPLFRCACVCTMFLMV